MAVVQTTQQNNQNQMAVSTPKKATNKTVTPVNQTMAPQSSAPSATQNPQTGGLIGEVTKTSFTPIEYTSDGYSGAQGNTNYNYTPSGNSLVENRITGLLDPQSAMMRKAVSQSQNFMAQRGLQSSSIANESALSSMIDKALPIASQDAATFGTADQTGWNHSFTATENNLNRSHDASMFDKNGALQTALQNNQFGFQNDQNNADRENQVRMAYLQQQNQLGLLDAQGKQELAQMERNSELTTGRDATLNEYQVKLNELQQQNQLGLLDAQGKQELAQLERNAALTTERDSTLNQYQNEANQAAIDAQNKQLERQAQLTSERDAILNNFQNQTNDKQYLQQLEQTKLQYENQDAVFEKQVSAQQALDYRNATSSAFNNYLAQITSIYSNPEMTAAQQSAGVAKLQSMFEVQRAQLQAIYGFAGEVDSSTNPSITPNPADITLPPLPAEIIGPIQYPPVTVTDPTKPYRIPGR